MKTLLIALAASTAMAFPALIPAQAQQSQPGQTQMQPQAGEQGQALSPQMMSKDQIKQVQDALKNKGLYKGEVDGVWGPETASAMRQFSTQHGGQNQGAQRGGTDRIDPQTLTALGLDPAQFHQGPGSPPSTAPGAPPSTTQPGSPGSPGTSPGLKPDNSSPGNTAPGTTPGGPTGNSPNGSPGGSRQ